MYLLFNQTYWILILTFRFIFVLLACANHNKKISFYTILLVWRRYGSARYKNGSLYDRILFNYFLFSSLNLKDIHPYFVFTQLLLVHFHQRERERERGREGVSKRNINKNAIKFKFNLEKKKPAHSMVWSKRPSRFKWWFSYTMLCCNPPPPSASASAANESFYETAFSDRKSFPGVSNAMAGD